MDPRRDGRGAGAPEWPRATARRTATPSPRVHGRGGGGFVTGPLAPREGRPGKDAGGCEWERGPEADVAPGAAGGALSCRSTLSPASGRLDGAVFRGRWGRWTPSCAAPPRAGRARRGVQSSTRAAPRAPPRAPEPRLEGPYSRPAPPRPDQARPWGRALP